MNKFGRTKISCNLVNPILVLVVFLVYDVLFSVPVFLSIL